MVALGAMAPGTSGEVLPEHCKGRQMIVELDEEEYEGKKKIKLVYNGHWELNHPDVADVPKDMAAIAQMGQATPVAVVNPTPAPPQPPPAPTHPPQLPPTPGQTTAPPAVQPGQSLPAAKPNPWGGVQ